MEGRESLYSGGLDRKDKNFTSHCVYKGMLLIIIITHTRRTLTHYKLTVEKLSHGLKCIKNGDVAGVNGLMLGKKGNRLFIKDYEEIKLPTKVVFSS